MTASAATAASRLTRWSLVEQAKGDTPQARAALSELCAIYYAPVHSFVRGWCRDSQTAQDLTHSFFARVLEGSALLGADAARGRFRAYLVAAVKHFITAQHRRDAALKRGSDLLAADAPDSLDAIESPALPPDVEFDRAWACAVLDRTLTQLEAEQQAAGKGHAFNLLKPWLAGTASHGDTLAAAQALNTSETAVRVQLSRLRKRMRELLHQNLADTLAEGGDVETEMRHLADALR